MQSQPHGVMHHPGARRCRTGTVAALAIGIVLGMLAGGATASGMQGTAPAVAPPMAAPSAGLADLKKASASDDVQYVAQWIADSGDNAGMPYIIIDKVAAKVFVLDVHGRLQGTAPALLGMVAGDGVVAGLGDEKLSAIRPEDRI